MKEFFNKYFFTQKREKINDKVLLTRMIITICVIILCLAVMAITAYAYFTSDVSSNSNTIKTSVFDANVSISSVTKADNDITVQKESLSLYTATLQPNTEYTITIEKTENCTANTGFCIITVDGCKEKYHTAQIGSNNDPENNKIIFTLAIDASSAKKVSFLLNWGTSSYYEGYITNNENNELYILNNENVTVTIAQPTINPPSTSDDKKPEDTTTVPDSETTTPESTTEDSITTETPETTGSPDTSTSEPEDTTTVPDSETTTPESTMEDSVTTEAPETTGTPDTSTSEPEDTTSAPTDDKI